jgi:hypothetical protein
LDVNQNLERSERNAFRNVNGWNTSWVIPTAVKTRSSTAEIRVDAARQAVNRQI